MEPLITFGESVLVFVAGLLLRFLIAVVGLTLVVLPILAVIMAVRYGAELRHRWQGLVRAGNLLLMRSFYYAPGHTWLKEETTRALRVGIDDLAQRLVGGARALRLAAPGTSLRRGDTLAEVELPGRTARIVSPIDATVIDVNERAERAPDVVRHDPYGKGWLALLAPAGGEFRRFPTGEAARSWLAGEDLRLTQFLEVRLGAMAADGGDYVLPPAALLDAEQWDEAQHEFLDATMPPA